MPDRSQTESATKLILPGGEGGRVLRHFRLEQLIGAGGMGQVYRAWDTQLHRPVAVKLLAQEVIADPQRKQRFLQEARAAARIGHPAVAQVYYVDEQDGVAFIAMELVEGKTVRELIQARSLDLLGALDIAIQVADGLAKAHDLGIVHRDIKPPNVMVTPDGLAKILDFGLAKLLDPEAGAAAGQTTRPDLTQLAETQTGMVMGTPAYMSPEQVRGLPVDHRADIFALGVLLYEMATGHSLFQRATFMDTLHAVAFDETPPMQSARAPIPPELQRIVTRCLRKRPEDRYADVRLVGRELRAVRRETEAGRFPGIPWRQRLADGWESLREMPPSRFIRYAALAAGLGVTLYFSLSQIGIGGALFLVLGGLLLYRWVRNRPQRLQALFVRRVQRIPEVRLITIVEQDATVVVDRPVAQLYGRINTVLNTCNRKLFFGRPLRVAVQHNLDNEQLQQLLAAPGVQYVRPDLVDASTP